MAEKILLIADDEPTASMISRLLEDRGYQTSQASSARTGLRLAYQGQPDLVLLDVELPDRDGWDVCQQLRDLSDMAIIVISASGEKGDVIRALEIGADDYLAKPLDYDELVARIKARLRRSTKPAPVDEIAFDKGELRIDFVERQVWFRDAPIHLTPKEYNLLAALARNAGRVVPRAELVTEAWGAEYGNAIDSLKLYIHYLRQKLERNPQQPKYIVTARGVGYRFIGE